MGEELYAQIVGADKLGLPCRVYAPVGSHEDLLPYLVRRLLENGANTSFVNRIVDEQTAIADIVRDPVARSGRAAAEGASAHSAAAHAVRLVAAEFARRESRRSARVRAAAGRHRAARRASAGSAAPIVSGKLRQGRAAEVRNPANRSEVIGIGQRCRRSRGRSGVRRRGARAAGLGR